MGKPYLSVSHRRRCPWPVACISRGHTLSTRSSSGVEAPTHAASSQCVFGRFSLHRLYLVHPPVPTSIGNSQVLNRLKSAQRIVLTAAASLRGRLACSCN